MTEPLPTIRPANARPSNGGFTLIEVLVVMIIVAIAIAMVMRTGFSSRTTATQKQAIGAASDYMDGINAFRREHRGRVPVSGGAAFGGADWPATPATIPAMAPVAPLPGAWGPVSNGVGGRPYLDELPDSIRPQRVVLVGSDAPSSAVRAQVAYVPQGTQRFGMKVYLKGVLKCAVGNATWVAAIECNSTG